MKENCKTCLYEPVCDQPMDGCAHYQPEVIRCKDCKYFELDHWESVNEIPLIVAHEICTRWGDGCKTSQDGYCFMAERKEE